MKKNIIIGQIVQLCGGVIHSLGIWLLQLMILKNYGIEKLGEYALYLAVATPIFLAAAARTRILLSTDTSEKVYTINYYIHRLTSSVVAFVLFLIFISYYVGNAQFNYLVAIIGMIKITDMQSDIVYGALQKKGCSHIVGILQTIKGILFLTYVSFVMLNENSFSLVENLTNLLLMSILMMAVELVQIKEVGKKNKFSWNALLNVVKLSRFYIIIAGIASLFGMIPRLTLGFYESNGVVGQYAAMYMIISASMILAAAFGQPLLRGLAISYSQMQLKDFSKKVKKIAIYLLILSLVNSIILLLIGDFVFAKIVGLKDVSKVEILMISLIAFLGMVNLNMWYMMALLNLNKLQLIISFVSVIFLCIISHVMIKKLGILGALAADFIGLFFQILLMFILIRKKVLKNG